MNVSDIVQALLPVVDAFERLEVRYYIGGSVASSAQGIARATADVDLVADLALKHVSDFVSALEEAYYVSHDAVKEAVRRRASFNVIHLETMLKVDVFVLKHGSYERLAFQRRIQDTIDESENSPRFYLASAEDIILNKLDWYRKGGGVSERQWLDVVGVMKVQGDRLDFNYLRTWASRLGLSSLLTRALNDADLPDVAATGNDWAT